MCESLCRVWLRSVRYDAVCAWLRTFLCVTFVLIHLCANIYVCVRVHVCGRVRVRVCVYMRLRSGVCVCVCVGCACIFD